MMIKDKKGFTLVEMLVSVAAFAVIATIVSSMFSTFANNQKRTKVAQELLNNTQYVIEVISREVKNNEIIAFGPSRCSSLDPRYTQCLLFVREDGQTAGFAYDTINQSLDYLVLECDRDESVYSNCSLASGQLPATMLSATYNNVEIESINLRLTPEGDPYYYYEPENEQPKVTISLGVKYYSSRTIEQAKYHLQTTVSSRIYKR